MTRDYSLRGAGASRDDVDSGGSRAAQVAMRQIEDLLIIGIAMNCGHESLLDAKDIVDDLGWEAPDNWLCRRRWTKCCAGRDRIDPG